MEQRPAIQQINVYLYNPADGGASYKDFYGKDSFEELAEYLVDNGFYVKIVTTKEFKKEEDNKDL